MSIEDDKPSYIPHTKEQLEEALCKAISDASSPDDIAGIDVHLEQFDGFSFAESRCYESCCEHFDNS